MKALAIILPLLGLMMLSCGEGESPAAEQKLVVEGWIDSGGYPVVLLSLSAVPQEDAMDVAENIIRWGVVTLSDGEQSVVLTGGPSDDYFPPFRYYTYEMRGEVGRTYSLTAEYQGYKVSSEVRMPDAPEGTRVERTAIEGSEGLDHLEVRFRAPTEGLPAWYHVSYRINGEGGRYLPSMLGAVEVKEPGAEVVMPVYRGKSSLSEEEFEPEMPRGKGVTVRLERVSEAVYRFWHAFDDAMLTEGSIFVSGVGGIAGNVSGGFGVWSAQGVEEIYSEP